MENGINGVDQINSQIHDEKLSNAIIRTMKRIKGNRSRPCYQNILTSLDRHFKIDLQMEELKCITRKLIDENIIQNNGKEGMGEYFNIVNGKQETLPDKRNVQEDTNSDSLENLINFVDERFFNTLTDFIKTHDNVIFIK